MVHHSELLFFFHCSVHNMTHFRTRQTLIMIFRPAGAEDADNHEWEEYDEPQPVIPDTSHTEEREGTNIDYDDPVQRHR